MVLFDGVCHLCQGSVRFIIKHDNKRLFQFAPLQGETAQRLLASKNKSDIKQSIILIEGVQVFTQSTAALRLARHLKFPINLLYVFIIVPKFIRDAVYQFISRNRYRWFGKDEQCMMPTPNLKERFLD